MRKKHGIMDAVPFKKGSRKKKKTSTDQPEQPKQSNKEYLGNIPPIFHVITNYTATNSYIIYVKLAKILVTNTIFLLH